MMIAILAIDSPSLLRIKRSASMRADIGYVRVPEREFFAALDFSRSA